MSREGGKRVEGSNDLITKGQRPLWVIQCNEANDIVKVREGSR